MQNDAQQVTKIVSKRDPNSEPKSINQKTTTNGDFQHPWMWPRCSKYKQNRRISGLDCCPCLALILEAFWEHKWKPRPSKSHLKKTSKKWCSKWAQTGPKGGPKMYPTSSNMRSWKHLVSRAAPKRPPEPLKDRFWRGFGTILGSFSSVFLTYVLWFLHAFFSSMLQTKTFERTRNNQNKIAESFQETSSLSMPSCIEQFKANANELSGSC